jgi:outer membrane protein assembly factor BamC
MRRLVEAAAVVLLAGCSAASSFIDGKVDYKKAGSLPPLEVPPDLTSPQRDSRYAIPEDVKSSATLSGYQAERRDQPRAAAAASPAAVLPQSEGMRVERAGTQRWLVVQEPPERVWPAVKAFWQELGFLVKLELPEAGVMETDWAEGRAQIQEGGVRGFLGRALGQSSTAGERDKFRTRLERAPDGKGTEIYISHRGMHELYTSSRDPVAGAPGDTRWQARDPDPGLEAEYLRRLMVRLGAHDEKARTLAAPAEAPVPQMRAELRKGIDGREVLDVHETFDRAWRRVGLALDRVGFTVEDRDRQKGLFFVRYADPEAEMQAKDSERGLFSRLFGSSDSKVKPEQYRVQVTQAGTSSQVNVLNKEGGADLSRTAQRILALLHEQLK